MQRTCGVEIKTHAALVAFCCAVSATGRAVVASMASKPDTAPATTPFITSALSKALAGVQHEDDSLDIQTPAALAVKALMLGAQEAGVSVHLDCIKVGREVAWVWGAGGRGLVWLGCCVFAPSGSSGCGWAHAQAVAEHGPWREMLQ